MAEDITVTTMEGRPVDPQVPGTTHDMDAAVATLLARHDATRTDGNPPWPPSWARYGTMWEERDKALAEVDRLRSENEHLRVALINCDQQRKEYQRRLDAISRNLDGFDLEADCG